MGQMLATLRAFFDGLGDRFDMIFDELAGLHDERLDIADPPQPHVQEPPVQEPSDVPKLMDYDIPAAFDLVTDLHAATRPLLTLLCQQQGSIHNNYLNAYNDMTSTTDAWEMEMEADDTDEALAESMMKALGRHMATVQEGYGKLFKAAVEIIAAGKETREELEKLGVWSILTERDDEDDQEVSDAEFRAMLATLD